MQQISQAIIISTLVAWVGFLSVLFVPSTPSAQDTTLQTLIQRLNRLQEDLRILQKDYYRGQKTGADRLSIGSVHKKSNGRLADAEIRMSNLESQMRSLTGELEELGHSMQTILQRLDGLVKDVDFRLTEIESRLAQTTGSSGANKAKNVAESTTAQNTTPNQHNDAANDESSVLPEGTPKERYKYAYSLLTKMQLAAAETAFQEFLEKHGDDQLASNAQYWLGETYYARQNLSEATRAFLVGIQRYPNSTKAPDSMLKLGISLAKLGKNEDSCAAFIEMQTKFPNLRTRLRKRMLKEMKAADCN